MDRVAGAAFLRGGVREGYAFGCSVDVPILACNNGVNERRTGVACGARLSAGFLYPNQASSAVA
ncbi:MAG: hypothetical protein FJZ96_07315 [Chloroflexi bacterium]|nr:hypothetical protein [Chloroflexota bacterium]